MSDQDLPIILSLEHIDKSFGSVPVLKDVSCAFRVGEVHCLMGENGAGKSTLIRVVSGAHQPDSGRIVFDGKTIDRYGPTEARELGIATIYQELDLIPNLTGAENIFLGREPRKALGRTDKSGLYREATRILTSMKVEVDLKRPVRELGVAQQQMIAIAKALSGTCKLLILDEPTAVFTATERNTLFDLLRRMRQDGIAIVLISHHMDEIFEIGNRVSVLRDGVVASTGPIADYDHDRLVRDMVGRNVARHARRDSVVGTQPMLKIEQLSDGKMVRNATLQVKAGEIVGIAGLIGSGRTETARMIFGANPIAAGQIRLRGEVFSPRNPYDAIRKGIGMVPEDRKFDGLVLPRSITENAGYPLARKQSVCGLVSWGRVRKTVAQKLQPLAIKAAGFGLPVRNLSGGNQQKVVLGRWLAAGVSLLILDEPTRGIDIGARTEIYQLIKSLADEGVGILLISSDLPEILALADRIVVMAKGSTVGELPGNTATEESIMNLAFRAQTGVAA